jgi:hypothetical protein
MGNYNDNYIEWKIWQEFPSKGVTSSLSLQRDSFIIPGIEVSFGALTKKIAFFPRKLMARLFAQNGHYTCNDNEQ